MSDVYQKLGANINKNGQVEFAVWAPYAKNITVEVRKPCDTVNLEKKTFKNDWEKQWHIDILCTDNKSKFIQMSKNGGNVFSAAANPEDAGEGDMYRYILTKRDGQKIYTKDPRSSCQPHIFSWSKIYNQNKYQWSQNEDKWLKGPDARKLSAKNPELTSLKAFAYVEVHIPTATKKGTTEAFKVCVDKLVKQGFQGILLMPAEGTYSVNWGYDGVDKYAVTRAWGEDLLNDAADIDKVNDSLKSLVDYCHQRGVNVGIDWVPSHITEEQGNVLENFGPYENVNKTENYSAKQWGGFTFNLEGVKDDLGLTCRPPDSDVKAVRRYIVDIPLYLVENYHFDFIRGDQSPHMYSNITMKLVKAEMDYHFPDVPVIWEDHRLDQHLCEPLSPEEVDNSSFKAHCKTTDDIENNKTSLKNIGADELWDFNFSHALEATILGIEVYPAHPGVENLADTILKGEKGTKFLLSHDEIGNHSGARIMVKYLAHKLKLEHHVEASHHKKQKAADAAKKLLEISLYDNSLNLNDQNDLNLVLDYYSIRRNTVSPHCLGDAVKEAFSYHKLGHGCVYVAPGSKMIFQGDNYGEINHFYFHRIQPVKETKVSLHKGYDVGEVGFIESKLDAQAHKNSGIHAFFKECNYLLLTQKALQEGKTRCLYAHNSRQVLVIERFTEQESLLCIMNFSIKSQNIHFHLLNSNFKKYFEIMDSHQVKFGGKNHYLGQELKFNEHNQIETTIEPINMLIYKNQA